MHVTSDASAFVSGDPSALSGPPANAVVPSQSPSCPHCHSRHTAPAEQSSLHSRQLYRTPSTVPKAWWLSNAQNLFSARGHDITTTYTHDTLEETVGHLG